MGKLKDVDSVHLTPGLCSPMIPLRIKSKTGESGPAFDIPDIQEYFMNLNFVLSVISHRPTKTFAFQRLKYLLSKFTMYTLLNES